jgi:hypothetical protein
MNILPCELKKLQLHFPIINIFIILITLFNAGCTGSGKNIDISNIDLEIEILRLDKDLFAIDIDSIPDQLPAIEEKYGEFFDIYNNLIIRIGSSRSPAYPEYLKSFLTDFDIYRLHNEVARVFPDLYEIEAELENAFKYYMHYFPDRTVPQIYSYISGFNQTVVTAENQLGIGLDKYLGSSHRFYHELQLPEYQRRKMHPGKITSDCIIAWAMTEFEHDDTDGHLLSHIIHHGKIFYFADAVLPDMHDSLKTGISMAGLEWCSKNESQMWTFLVENKLLFSTDTRTIARYTNDGPFTSEFSRDSPARATLWLGRQIVRSYMRRNSHVSLQELMLDIDYQSILNNARYRP